MWFVCCSSKFVVVTEAEWNTLCKFCSADQAITVQRDLQSNTLVTQPGEYFYLRQDRCSKSHQIILLAYCFSLMNILWPLFQATTFHHCHIFISVLFLLEGRVGEACEPSNKVMFFLPRLHPHSVCRLSHDFLIFRNLCFLLPSFCLQRVKFLG